MSIPEISFKLGTMLVVDGHHLRTDRIIVDEEKTAVTPEELHTILALGDNALRQQIEIQRENVQARNPQQIIASPSLWVAQVTDGRHGDFFGMTARGKANTSGVVTNALELKPFLRDHWNAIRDAGFVPEARRNSTKKHVGTWLMARIDPTPL
jgi:hypothetical protein